MQNDIDFFLRRGYFLYTSKNSSFVTVTDYDEKGVVEKERPISKNELSFIHKTTATATEKKQNIIVDYKSTCRLIKFSNFPFELVWKVEAKKRTLTGNDGEVEVSVPLMIFHVVGTSLMVYFYKITNKGHMITPCTYPNVFADYVCLGNVKVDRHMAKLSEEMDKWESYFFDTEFTGNNFKPETGLKYKIAPWI